MTEPKKKGGRPRSRDPVALRKFKTKSVPRTEELLERSIKVMNEHIKRHEAAMFNPKLISAETGKHVYDSSLARECKDLASAVANLGSMYIRVQKEAKLASDMLTLDEKIEAVVAFTRELGKLQARKFLSAMYPAIRELEKAHLPPPRASGKE